MCMCMRIYSYMYGVCDVSGARGACDVCVVSLCACVHVRMCIYMYM